MRACCTGCRVNKEKHKFFRSIHLTKLGVMTCLSMVQDGIRLAGLLYTETFLNMSQKNDRGQHKGQGTNKRGQCTVVGEGRALRPLFCTRGGGYWPNVVKRSAYPCPYY